MDAVPNQYVEATGAPVAVLLAETRVGLLAPSEIRSSGVTVANTPGGHRACRFDLVLRLDQVERRYTVPSLRLLAAPDHEIREHLPELARAGITGTTDLDAEIVDNLRTESLRRATMTDGAARSVPVVDGQETDLYDENLTDTEVVALLWLQARLTFTDPNVSIADYYGATRQAAAQRLFRARKAGAVPPADRRGARKARR